MKAIQIIKTIILFGFGAFLSNLIISGQFRQYVHPRFEIALIMADCFFFLLAIVQATISFFDQQQPHDHYCDHDHHHHDQHDCQDNHGHQQGFKRELITCALLALPLICAFCFPFSSLGSDMVGKKTTNPTTQVNTGAIVASDQEDAWDPIISDDKFLTTMMILYSQPADYVKQNIEFSGFVYHQDNFPEDCFLVARYAISCCAADAQVTGLLCRFPNQQKIPNDQWVRAKGKITVESYQGHDIPVVEGYSLQLTEALQNPYVY